MFMIVRYARAARALDNDSTARINPTVSLLKPPMPGRHRAERAMTDMPGRASFGGAHRSDDTGPWDHCERTPYCPIDC